jgi:ferritin-like metal-binding protein YciE
MDTFAEPFEETLKDICYTEKAILKALPRPKGGLQEAAASLHQTPEGNRGAGGALGAGLQAPRQAGCRQGLSRHRRIIEEGAEVMKKAKDDTVRDAAMLAAAQSVEHYEISRATARSWPGPKDERGRRASAGNARRGEGNRRSVDGTC